MEEGTLAQTQEGVARDGTRGDHPRRSDARSRPRPARTVARAALAAALAECLSLVSLPASLFGGSVSFATLPVVVAGVLFGARAGAAAGLLFGALKLLTNAKVYGVAQALLDYPLAYGAAGLAAALPLPPAAAALAACLARFACHVTSGVIYFNSSVAASVAVNGAYMVPVTALTVVAVAALDRSGTLGRIARRAGSGE